MRISSEYLTSRQSNSFGAGCNAIRERGRARAHVNCQSAIRGSCGRHALPPPLRRRRRLLFGWRTDGRTRTTFRDVRTFLLSLPPSLLHRHCLGNVMMVWRNSCPRNSRPRMSRICYSFTKDTTASYLPLSLPKSLCHPHYMFVGRNLPSFLRKSHENRFVQKFKYGHATARRAVSNPMAGRGCGRDVVHAVQSW